MIHHHLAIPGSSWSSTELLMPCRWLERGSWNQQKLQPVIGRCCEAIKDIRKSDRPYSASRITTSRSSAAVMRLCVVATRRLESSDWSSEDFRQTSSWLWPVQLHWPRRYTAGQRSHKGPLQQPPKQDLKVGLNPLSITCIPLLNRHIPFVCQYSRSFSRESLTIGSTNINTDYFSWLNIMLKSHWSIISFAST